MEILSSDVSLEDFLNRLDVCRERLLLLDYDGTLAPFREERMEATPYPGVRPLLDQLLEEGHTRVVIISGRKVEEVKSLLALSHPVEIWGTHGWERLDQQGNYSPVELPEGIPHLLKEAARVAADDDDVDPGRIEEKPASTAFHVRGLDEERCGVLFDRVKEAWQDLSRGHDQLAVEQFDGGVEIRVLGRNKGDSVRDILESAHQDRAVAYLGDDRTDEDAFRALEGEGLRLLVRREFRPTRADIWLVPPDELLQFLRSWREAI